MGYKLKVFSHETLILFFILLVTWLKKEEMLNRNLMSPFFFIAVSKYNFMREKKESCLCIFCHYNRICCTIDFGYKICVFK